MKLVKSFVAVSLFSGALIVACGGSSSQNPNPPGNNNDAGNPSTDSGGIAAADTGTGTAADTGAVAMDAGPACGTTKDCATGTTCCASAAGLHCVSGPCTGATVGCMTTGDCTGGEVCCGSFSGTSIVSACQAAPCASGAYELCTPGSTQCPAGDTCNQLPVVPVGYCVAAPDAGPGTDGGDAGNIVLDSGVGDATGE